MPLHLLLVAVLAAGAPTGLADPQKKDIAMQLVSSAENSSLDWKAQYNYIEDIGDGRGYTAGIIGFCSGTGDMLELVELYTQREPGNVLRQLPARRCGTSTAATRTPGSTRTSPTTGDARPTTPAFQQAQNDERDRVYFNPAVQQAKADGLRRARPVHLLRRDRHARPRHGACFGGIRERRAGEGQARRPQGGDETTYLERLPRRAGRGDAARRRPTTTPAASTPRSGCFLSNGNLDLDPPLRWKVYGDDYSILR